MAGYEHKEVNLGPDFGLRAIFHEDESQLSGLGPYEKRGEQLKKLCDDERAKRLIEVAIIHLKKLEQFAKATLSQLDPILGNKIW